MKKANHQTRPLTVDECRQLMGWHDRSDKEISEFLGGLRVFLGRCLDDHFKDEFLDEDM